MTSEDELIDLVLEAWDQGRPLYREMERRFSDQFAKQLLGEDTMPRLRTLYRVLAEHKPLTILIEDLGDLPAPPFFTPAYLDYLAKDFPPELRATAADFFRTVTELVTRYADEFIARNAALATSAPEHNREYHFLNRTVDQILVWIEDHFNGPPVDAVVEFGIASVAN